MFFDLPDPRAANAHHALSDILFIALSATLCGANNAADFAQFARSKRGLLLRVLGSFDPPSHDTFSRVFRLLDADAFDTVLTRFASAFGDTMRGGVVAIDGKAMRRAYEAGSAATPPMMVTAWAEGARKAVGMKATGGKGAGEAETAIALVKMLDLADCTVTTDALHCHRRMAKTIRASGGDYALALKGNQPALQRDAKAYLAHAKGEGAAHTAQTSETAHGRSEWRHARVTSNPKIAQRMAVEHDFDGLTAIGCITTKRITTTGADNATSERIYLLSRAMDAEEFLAVARAHWSVENTLHWSLDVTLGEDQSRARKDNAPSIIAVLNRLALTMLQTIDDPKTSIRQRIKKCAWDEDYLINAISHMR